MNRYQKNFDEPVKKKKSNKKYIPLITHAWRRQSCIAFRNKQLQRETNTQC